MDNILIDKNGQALLIDWVFAVPAPDDGTMVGILTQVRAIQVRSPFLQRRAGS